MRTSRSLTLDLALGLALTTAVAAAVGTNAARAEPAESVAEPVVLSCSAQVGALQLRAQWNGSLVGTIQDNYVEGDIVCRRPHTSPTWTCVGLWSFPEATPLRADITPTADGAIVAIANRSMVNGGQPVTVHCLSGTSTK